MDKKDFLDELIKETQRRQRKKTDLSAYNNKLKEMLDLNISLPVILDWIIKEEKNEKYTTLPALRRYVVRTFGEGFYHDFMKRNGWLKTKSKNTLQNDQMPEDKYLTTTEGVVTTEGNNSQYGVTDIEKILSQPAIKYPPRKNKGNENGS
ncbi:MAG: hypothetical protein PHT57_09175 [Rhodoferax sp.]|nr:hypothetical protein [Rhodoferax sp.]